MSKLYHVPVFLLLAIATAIQLNDPDPLFWGGFYLLCALVPLLAGFNIHNWILYGVCALYGVIAIGISVSGGLEFLHHVPGESLLHDMSPDKPYIEETRELLGSAIAVAIVVAYAWFNRKKAKTSLSSGS